MANDKLARRNDTEIFFAEEFCIMELEDRTEFLAVDVIGLAATTVAANLNVVCPNTNCPCNPPPPPPNLLCPNIACDRVAISPVDTTIGVVRTPISE